MILLLIMNECPYLVMAFCTINSTHAFGSNLFTGFGFVVDSFEGIIVFVGFKLHLGFAVTIYTPTHRKVRKLFYEVHGFNGSVAGLALDLSCFHMLGMTEKYMIRKFVDSNPFNRFA